MSEYNMKLSVDSWDVEKKLAAATLTAVVTEYKHFPIGELAVWTRVSMVPAEDIIIVIQDELMDFPYKVAQDGSN